MRKRIDLTGQKFNRLTVKSFSHTDAHRSSYWNCTCDCGNTTIVRSTHLKAKHTQSCGCVQREAVSKHGKWQAPEFNVWSAIFDRCYNPNTKRYPYYGGRGIKICDRWKHSFQNFIDDMGERPSSKHSIDRIDNNKDYTPDNCRWATYEQQNNNRSNTVYVHYKGFIMRLTAAMKVFNLTRPVLQKYRI